MRIRFLERGAVIAFCCRVAVMVGLLVSIWAQSHQARLAGRVVDETGAVVPGAEVSATNEATGVSNRGLSNELGLYLIPPLEPGIYTVAVELPGFKRYEQTGLRLSTGERLDLEIRLQVGEITETVTVSGDAPVLESATATLSQVVDSRVVTEMPLINRRALELVRLAGATVFVNYSGLAKPNFSLAGGRTQNQMFWLDGGTIQNMRLGIGQVDVDPPVDVIREFRVVQNTYSAEYGGSAGGLIVSTTKSGSNELHGSLFEYFRNDALNAAGFFTPVEGATGEKIQAPLRYNLFGGTLGGPILKNKTHFFAGFEGTRRTDGFTQILTVPSLLQRQGDFSQTVNNSGKLIPIYDPFSSRVEEGKTVRDPFPGNQIPADRIDPVSQKLIHLWPAPNRQAANPAGAQNFAANRARLFRRDNITARVDHVLAENNRLYFRLIYNRDPFTWTSNYPTVEADPESERSRYQTSYLVADTHTFSPSLVAETRYTFAHRIFHNRSLGLGSTIVDDIGLKGVTSGAFPAIRVSGMANLGVSSERRQFPIRQHQFVNNWTYTRGSHVWKFGGELGRSRNFEVNRPIISGQYNFATTGTALPGKGGTGHALASFLSGFVNTFSLRETDELDRHSWYLAWFAQDDWKVSSTLTLNLGVRFETDTPITDKNNRMNGFDAAAVNPVSGTAGVVRFAGVGGWPQSPYDVDWNNFGPRVGFAWRPGAGAWVVRGGYGVFYEHPFAHGAPSSASLGFERSAGLSSPDNGITPAFILRQGVTGVSLESPNRDDGFGAAPPGQRASTNVSFYEQGRRTGYAQQFNLGIQRQLDRETVVEIAYVGNLGRKMPVSNININQVAPERMGPGNAQSRRPFPQFNNVQIHFPSFGVNNYHAGVFRLERRFARGLSFLSSYTWSRNIGNIDYSAGGEVGDNQLYQDYYNRRLDKGANAIDINHVFNWSSLYDLPWGRGRRWLQQGALSHILGGWTLGAILTTQSGGPFTVTMQTNTANAFSSGALRADLVRDPQLPSGQRTVERWFDTDAFHAPAPHTFGNAGRGIIRADGRFAFDVSLNKNIYLSEETFIQFRSEFFNAFNHADFMPPNHVMGSPGYGTISEATDPRTLQFGLRIVF